jgi:predicted nucleotidyltransferase
MKIQGHTILFKTIVGSQSYGTNVEGSDIDYKGVFIQDPYDKYMNGYRDELEINKDEKYFELEKFLLSCSTGNPTLLELLYAPEHCIVHITDTFKQILEFKHLFLTKNLRHSFANYAKDQVRKASGLEKKMNWEKDRTERKSVEDMCSVYSFPKQDEKMFETNAIKLSQFLAQNNFLIENCGLSKIDHFRDSYLLFNSTTYIYRGITTGEDANDVCLSEIEIGAKPVGILFFHKDAYSQHCKYYKEYQEWLEKRNTERYVDIQGHGQQIDGKNILHNIRIIETAMEIPTDKTINIFRPNREYLIDIRRGKYDLQTLMDKSENDLEVMYELFKNSDLPDKFEHQEMIKEFIDKTRSDFFTLNTQLC